VDHRKIRRERERAEGMFGDNAGHFVKNSIQFCTTLHGFMEGLVLNIIHVI
jgi:hypothetical protein